jgi:peptidoglycan/xylan/chitin deacetylase (PgdA/CDA1 family)
MFGIKNKLRSLKELFAKKAIILMYHRISEPGIDPWELAVSPVNFKQQLQVLQNYRVSTVSDVAIGVQKSRLKNKSIALSFDDGYRDNFENALPLLEKYDVPATFFITNIGFGEEKLYWWDRLANLILQTPELPKKINLTIGGEDFNFSIEEEIMLNEHLDQLHRSWIAPGIPPTKRSILYYKLWQLMQPLPPVEIEVLLHQIKNWTGTPGGTISPDGFLITEEQFRKLADHHLIDIGIHTANHIALGFHSAKVQENEILENQKQLEQIINRKITTIAYPYGEYNNTTLDVVKRAGLLSGFTVEYNLVSHTSNPFKLGRFHVKNWNGAQFEENLVEWMKQ